MKHFFMIDKILKSGIAAALVWVAAMPAFGRDVASYATSEAHKHEMRGAWVATVYGIDWPSKTGVTSAVAEEQKRELREILDVLKNAGLNAVMFQVRSMSDAMYASSYEPWSAYLTGERGVAPAKGWDPLAFAVEETHKRGMELHAWVNPFRLANGAAPAPEHAAKGKGVFSPQEKGWVISYSKTEKGAAPARRKGKKGRRAKSVAAKRRIVSILNPGHPGARKHIVDVCREIVRNYDVDGLIFDDYFYPDGLPLGSGYDYTQWKKECVASDGKEVMSQADWRRENVAKTVKAVGDMLAEERPWVRFGISPAGVGGGNGKATERFGLNPPSVGSDWMYDRIFCDPLSWLADGSVDYVSPQIYWSSDHATNPYIPIACWWEDVALHFGRHCYPSQKVLAKAAGQEAWEEQELQVKTNRKNCTGSDAGSVFYSTAHLSGKKARGLGEHLRKHCYNTPALMPPMPWKKAENPGAVKDLERRGSVLSWYPANEMRYVVYAVPESLSPLDVISGSGANFMAEYIVAVTYGHSVTLPSDKLSGYWYAVAPYDRYGNEWEASIIDD